MLERTRRNAELSEQSLWPSGVVPIIFDDTYPESDKTFVLTALYELEKEVNGNGHCIKVLPISKKESYLDHVKILYVVCCNSQRGAQQERGQIMMLGKICLQVNGTSQHELMHALGFGHEQSRMDRDNYVTIVEENIQPIKLRDSSFEKYKGKTFGLPYDYDSIMHYPRFAFAINTRKPTIITKNGEEIGNRYAPSKNDIERIRRLYSCSSNGVIFNEEKEIKTPAGMKEVEFSGGKAHGWYRDWWKSGEDGERYAPKRAFSRQTSLTEPWFSSSTPTSLWYNFTREVTVARFGFRNQRQYDLVWNNPVTFSFVGSKDCVYKKPKPGFYWRPTWEKIVSISNTTWPKGDFFQFWDVDKKDRMTSRCFGFYFYDSSSAVEWSGEEMGRQYVAVQDVRMWEAQDTLADAEISPSENEDSEDAPMTQEPVQEKLTSEQKNRVQNDLARVRLVNREGLSNKSGRLEVLVDGQWGSICDDTGDNRRWSAEGHVDSRVSKVVCAMYGYTGVGIVVNEWGRRMTEMAKEEVEDEAQEEEEELREKYGNAPLRWSKLRCKGNEISLFDCTFSDDMGKKWRKTERYYWRKSSRGICKSHETIGIHCF